MKNYMSTPFEFGSKTYIMGIMNVTPDSFSGDGLLAQENYIDAAIRKAHLFIQQEVDIIDIGGESTRPGSVLIPLVEELARVIPVIRAIRDQCDLPISIDTTKASVAEAALEAGATIINDVSGLMLDPQMIETAIKFDAQVILMHSPHSYPPEQRDEGYRFLDNESIDIVEEVASDLEKLAILLISRGLKKENIILDPGIGFGKTVKQNLALVNGLARLKKLGYPVLIGASRKSFIGYTTRSTVENRLGGSLAAATISVLQGVDILRVHDVEETKQAVTMAQAIRLAS